MKKRILSVLICISVIVSSLSGCSDTAGTSAPSGESISGSSEQPKQTSASATEKTEQTTTSSPEEVQPEEFSLYDIPVKIYDPFAAKRTDVSFSELKGKQYEGADELRAAISRMAEACEEQDALEELVELYGFIVGEYLYIKTLYSVASIEYDMDSRNEELLLRSTELNDLLLEIVALLSEATLKVAESDYGDDFAERIGEGDAENYMGKIGDHDFERVNELMLRENELLADYYLMSQASYSVEYNGEAWTSERYNDESKTLPKEDKRNIYCLLSEKRNEKCAPVYIGLVGVRKEIAAEYGYESAAEYFYKEVYGRDYLPEEAQLFHEYVREHIVPVYTLMNEADIKRPDAVVETEDVLPIMRSILPHISEEMTEIFDYMTEHGLILLADDLNVSRDAGYTAPLDRYALPVIYNSVYGDSESLSDTFHEFGHFCDFYLNGIYGAVEADSDYDLAEVSSIGLECLVYGYYDEMMDGNTADEKLHRLKNMFYSIVSGCMYDEAQQRIYEYEGELTADAVNEIFMSCAVEYGMEDAEDYNVNWINIPHHFDNPFYMISYAVSTSAAMEMWLTAQTQGEQAATDLYLEALSRGSFEYHYSEVMEELGMSGISSEEYFEKLADAVLDEMELLVEQLEPQDAA